MTTELRASVTPDGAVWASPGFAFAHWVADLDGFRDITVALRVAPVERRPDRSERLDGPRIGVLALPPLRLDRRLPTQLVRAARRLAAADGDRDVALLLTCPGVVGTLGLIHAVARRRPYAVQVVGDPLDVTGRARIGGRARRLVGGLLAAAQWLACRRAVAVRYVTDAYLQDRYPPGRATASHAVSNVVLAPRPSPAEGGGDRPEDAVHPTDAPPDPPTRWRLVTVASLDQPYKRVDLLIEALEVLRDQGWDLHLEVVGGGRLQPALEAQATAAGLADRVTFHGAVPRSAVDEIVAQADLFVLCSDTEGMPRALIEAMSAGRPCIGSAVGGVPELLAPEGCFEPGSLPSLVSALRRHLVSPRLRERAAGAALERAADFAPPVLASAHQAFLAVVADRATRSATAPGPERRRPGQGRR